MQTYLKTKPVWIQILLFIGMAFGIMMIFFIIGGLILSKLAGVSLLEMSDAAKWDASDPKMLFVIRGLLLIQFLGLFLVPSLLFGYFSDPKPMKYLGLKSPSKIIYWVLGIAVMLIAIPLVEYIGLLNQKIDFGNDTRKWMQGMEEDAARTIKVLLSKHTISELLTNLVFIAVFAGVGEELVFRGILQRLLIRAFKSPWVGIILAAFFFSFFHLQFFGFFPRFLLGILLGAIYWYSGSLWVAIAAHFVYDAVLIVLAYFNPKMLENPNATLVDQSALGIMALVSAALVGLIVWTMKKNSTTSYTEIYKDDKPPEQDFTF